MRSIILAAVAACPLWAFAQQGSSEVKLKLRFSRGVVIACMQADRETKITGSSDDLTLMRVGGDKVSYEIYREGFIVASCDNISVSTP